MPVPIAELAAPYPADGRGEAHVALELVLAADGRVTSAKALDGVEPFASAAVAAAKQWVFHPATRDGKPVSARIRVDVPFVTPARRQPPTPAAGAENNAASSSPSSSGSASNGGSPAADEVQITGTRALKSATEQRLTRQEIRMVPGAFGDPFRAIETQGGVVPIISGLPYFFIRGAPPSAVGYYIDEVRVPYLFHFALGPGVVNPALIESVTLHPAAYPGRFGRFAGGIVAGQTRDPSPTLTGEAQIRLYDAGAYVETPVANGRGSVGLGGRYSYTAAALSLASKGNFRLDYRDYNARASYNLTDRTRLSVLTLGAFDYASEREDNIEDVVFASEFHRVDVRLDHRGANGAFTRVATTLGLDRTRISSTRFAQTRMLGLRTYHRNPITNTLQVEVGADTLAEFTAGDVPSIYAVRRETYDSATEFFAPRTDTATGAWFTASYQPKPRLTIEATLRGDLFSSDGKTAFGPSPRVSVRAPLIGGGTFVGAFAVASQPPAFAFPIPAIGFRKLPGGLGFSYQKSAGVEWELPWSFRARAVGFHHSYQNMRTDFPDNDNEPFSAPPPIVQGASRSIGLEASVTRSLSKRFSGFTTMTFSRTTLGSAPGIAERLSRYDRSYVIQLGGAVDLGRNWRASSRLLTYSGWPSKVASSGSAANTVDSAGRSPGFTRLDARIEKRWLYSNNAYLSLVFEGLNITANRETVQSCSPSGTCTSDELGPIVLPNIALEGAL